MNVDTEATNRMSTSHNISLLVNHLDIGIGRSGRPTSLRAPYSMAVQPLSPGTANTTLMKVQSRWTESSFRQEQAAVA